MPQKPFLWFPEPALALPIIILTRATVPMTDHLDDPEPRRTLCAGRDVAMVHPIGHFSEPRAREWQAKLAWDAPEIKPYAQADGTVVLKWRRSGVDATDRAACRPTSRIDRAIERRGPRSDRRWSVSRATSAELRIASRYRQRPCIVIERSFYRDVREQAPGKFDEGRSAIAQ